MTEAAPAEHAEPTLRLRGVGRRFGGLHAVREVTLDVLPGERRAILGPNGAGKTTLFNVIAGDLAPSAGRVELLGEDVTTLPSRARARLGLARTYQQSRLLLGLTVENSIYLSATATCVRSSYPGGTRSSANGHGRPPDESRSRTSSTTSSGRSRTASIGRWRSPWRSHPSPRS